VTARDRTVLIVVGLLALLGGFWFLAISPKRKEASEVTTKVAAAQTRLDTAQASAASADAARKQYSSDYATVARLGKAVPVDDDMPSLVYQLSHTAKVNHVDFRAIKLTGSSTPAAAAPAGAAAAVASANGTPPASSSTPAATVAPALPPGATVGTAGFPTMPFSFSFAGSFVHMQRFLKAINGLTSVQGKNINVTGRLLTVDGVALKAGPNGFPDVDATVAVTAFLLPADEGLTAGATPATPATGTASTATASLIGSDR
jgi:type II secretory pathway pseudopilin PulG